jgi:hypothetical protein
MSRGYKFATIPKGHSGLEGEVINDCGYCEEKPSGNDVYFLVRHGSKKTKIGSEYNPKRVAVCRFRAFLLTEMDLVM